MSSASSATIPAVDGSADPTESRLLASFSGLVLILDRDGTIIDVSTGVDLEPHPGWRKLVGRPWLEVVLGDSKAKVERLMEEAISGTTTRTREVNLRVDGMGDLPFRCTGSRLDDERIIVLGLDIRDIAELQQRMISSQQAMDLEFERMRQSEAQYRVLFHVSAEGVLIAQGPRHSILEANPAAATLLNTTAEALHGKSVLDLFVTRGQESLATLVASVKAGKPLEITLEPKGRPGTELTATATMFRKSGAVVLLLRLWPAGAAATTSASESRVLDVIEAMPDAFVVAGEDLNILSANPSFCELVQQATEGQVVGQSLDRWLGRPGVDLNIIVSNLREHGMVRSFSTIIRGDFGAEQGATVAAVSAPEAKMPCYGFIIRPMTSPMIGRSGPTFQARSAEQLRDLVGRVSLKAIVKESADLIERLCIEVALDLSGNNRAAAAQLLGLSRQSLYSKLRRHRLEEFQPS
ncbi:MAG: transcriptional regulator PpsR [Nannocystaceae bacterium]